MTHAVPATTDRDSASVALTRASVEAVLTESGAITRPDGPYLRVLRWLVWLPLLSIRELARIMHRDEQTVWGYLKQLGQWKLAGRVLFGEPGWPGQHQRHYITDLGLYVLVACHPRRLSAPKLAASYAIERADLLARLARPQVHLVLSDLVSRLLSELPDGYQLTSYQQPWRELYRWGGVGHEFRADAALLLRSPNGREHAFYVLVDQPERLFSQHQEKACLEKLLTLRQVAYLHQEVFPQLLLLSEPVRFSFWAELLEQCALTHTSALLAGAIADYGQLRAGMAAPIWLPLRDLISQQAGTPPVYPQQATSFVYLPGTPASPQLIERFSQRRSLEHLLAQPESGTRASGRQRLTRYVGDPLQLESNQFRQDMREQPARVIVQLSRSLHSARGERTRMAALLNLVLSAQQKTILALLVRHPALSLADLLFHLHPQGSDPRALQQQLDQVRDLQLVCPYPWQRDVPARTSWHERLRYEITELGCRFLAMRHDVPPAHYLHPLPKDDEPLDRRKVSPLDPSFRWVQRSLRELKRQLPHTNSLYRTIRQIIAAGSRSGRYEIVFWKSARESICWCFDRLRQEPVFARPDAELLYRVAGSAAIRHLFIECDRGTTFVREYHKKFAAYAAYQRTRRTSLPPIVVVTPTARSAGYIRRTIAQAGGGDVLITIVLEHNVAQQGLLAVPGLLQSD